MQIPMHKHLDSISIRPARSLRAGLITGLMLAMLLTPPLLRSQTMSESPAEPTSDWATHERLKKLIPERVGKWKLFGTGPEPMRIDGFQPSGVLAEFRRGKQRVQVRVGHIEPKTLLLPAVPIERNSVEGSEKLYAEGNARVRETHRAIDGRTEVSVTRPDGVVASAHSFLVPASELKAILLGFKATSP
jgi:hypothetical protein